MGENPSVCLSAHTEKLCRGWGDRGKLGRSRTPNTQSNQIILQASQANWKLNQVCNGVNKIQHSAA